jgi:hypothetical protein
MAGIALLGTYEIDRPFVNWLLHLGASGFGRAARKFARSSSATASLHRVCDLVVWDSPSGTRVIAGLASVADNQSRVTSVISGIDRAQLAMAGIRVR